MTSTRVRWRGGSEAGIFGKLFLSVFFLIFFAAGAFFTAFVVREVWRTATTFAWRKVDCQVTSSSVVEDRKSSDSNPYRFAVAYTYWVDGKTHTSARYQRNGGGFSDYAEAQRLADRYPAGSGAVCFVNPSNATEAILERQSFWMALMIPFPLIFVAIGAGGVFFTWRKSKPPVEKKVPISSVPATANAARFLTAFFAIFFLIGAAVLYAMFIRPVIKTLDARGWVVTPCVVESSQVKSHRGDDSTTYSVDILYRYTVNGKEYKSSRYHFMGGSSSGYRGKAAVVNRHPPGQQTVCYVNPKDPTEAVLERGFTGDLWFGLIPMVFMLVGGGGIYFTRRNARRERAMVPAMKWLPKQARPEPAAARASHSVPATAAATGSVVLKPASAPWVKLVGAILVAAFWNGIVSVFLFQVVQGWQRGRTEWFLTIFLIPFVLVGLALIGGVGYYLLALFNPRPTLIVSSNNVPLGGTLDLQWRLTGRVEVVEQLRIYLEGREEATYRRGTSTCTDKEVFTTIELANATTHADKRAGQGRVRIPDLTMHSFESGNNKVAWSLVVHGKIRRWPDVKEEFPIVILPAPAQPPLPT